MAAVTLLQKWQLLQAIIADADLSQTSKLVAARLLYHHSAQTGRCCPSYQTLADGVALKRRAVINAVQELEAGSWIVINQVKGGAAAGPNRYATNTFQIDFSRGDRAGPTVHDGAPSTVHEDALLHDDNSAPLCTPPVHDGAPSTVHGDAPYSGKDTGKGNREESPPTPSDFDEWWRAYPRKVGKDAAQPVFIRITKARKATVAELIEGAKRYAAERAEQDPQFTKHPKTWLNGGHWADEAVPKPVSHANGRQPFSALGRLQENMYDDD
ncbi:helix-turn-helix domain-containing protein [Methylobacterium sp. E-016]|uniref:helix-turn-helix domain-containing protein n=1 Tax=Methylobacterium sp. E-016 TaxID=2836556 RepID=UPI001FB92BD1|nr:helix-turn-helix domain-containing protein [Methylobacterium sp. E-016]MCJ2077895.1 helix-turn-helix domain-containing protein [Methylobacterium sp. E-016]